MKSFLNNLGLLPSVRCSNLGKSEKQKLKLHLEVVWDAYILYLFTLYKASNSTLDCKSAHKVTRKGMGTVRGITLLEKDLRESCSSSLSSPLSL